MAKSDLARRLQTRQTELDVVLQELERAGRVKLTEIKGKLVVEFEGWAMTIDLLCLYLLNI